ncbi:hypothetical protein M011DRAFT_411012 [Sporormia fimetaria CBS 119925]|uniref:EF-hand domain-containing protein n=1 Tax=Sporormia fimetaria CBS 119925 TaxID=1340428 RepID=A0A6A6UZR5_9PLEO|nr:hypothetical protein M011DRAFT_411012 [Sporormia fimetaria CBS 119925]
MAAHTEQYLTDDEIKRFVDDLDKDNNGNIEYEELEHKLDEVHNEIAPKPQPHNLHHSSRGDEARHQFLRSVMGTSEDRIPVEQFKEIVKTWNIPSLEQDRKEAKEEDEYLKHMSIWRRVRAYWAVKGPEIMFLCLVLAFMIAFGVWQFTKYLTQPQYRAALGWGVVVAKTSAGILYPTFFFLILSMSRWFSTWLRHFRHVSRFINWDLSQSFHIKMSIVALFFATLHAIGHLSGSFVFGSRSNRQEAVAVLLGPDAVPRSYVDYVRSLPGFTGLSALGCFYLLALLSMPQVRKWNYQVFQLSHLLMFPIIGLLMAHGTAGLLQWPMFGYWLAFPTLLVLLERTWRVILGFWDIPADIEVLDEETVCITLSRFEWHPFTVSTCTGNKAQLHIKADGDWTNALYKLAKPGQKERIIIGIDGPFGAPAQRFYEYEYSMVVGAGIGITPFSGILTDLQYNELQRTQSKERDSSSDNSPYANHRRIDFHWMVRDRNNLLWFSDLLNNVTRANQEDRSHLDIRIQTYVTQKRKEISTHVFRWLLEKHRTKEHPQSPLTGLINETHYGRPELGSIMEEHYQDMCRVLTEREKGEQNGLEKGQGTGMGDQDEIKVGVFFCGAPVIGQQLADRCRGLTARGRQEGRKVEYYFMMEVFG